MNGDQYFFFLRNECLKHEKKLHTRSSFFFRFITFYHLLRLRKRGGFFSRCQHHQCHVALHTKRVKHVFCTSLPLVQRKLVMRNAWIAVCAAKLSVTGQDEVGLHHYLSSDRYQREVTRETGTKNVIGKDKTLMKSGR
ncbi:hypothetical protein, unlikely [Trypanosoma congolense IL3000]|uniref:Uncharacterized protein n=1 Tax=Trypanosoma congolense (strain IL3000) TaxID=1068625 RepID=F9W6U1_TRYCI|nr:hypothetical protein, unlikely [Trypanosoma congolense IL3000]